MREEVNCPKNREKKKGMVAFDLDHTLLDHKKGAITPSSLEAIERKMAILWCWLPEEICMIAILTTI